jgi:transcription initiation factor IIE alpha subunit
MSAASIKIYRDAYNSEQLRNTAFSLVDLTNKQKQVYDIIKKWQPISNERIAIHLGVYPHVVTPRVLELRDLGVVEFYGEDISQTSKRKVSLWRIKPDGKQLSLNI